MWIIDWRSAAIATYRRVLRKAHSLYRHRAGINENSATRAETASAPIVPKSSVSAFGSSVRNSEIFKLDEPSGRINEEHSMLIVAADREQIRSRSANCHGEFNEWQRALQHDRSTQT